MAHKTGKKQTYSYEPDYAVVPGQTLLEVIESLNMSQRELATRTGLTEQTIVRVIKGEQPITYETANKLELVTGVPARMWNNLEMQFREQLSKVNQRINLEKSLEWLKMIPTKELMARGVIPSCADRINLLREVFKFYGVSSVDSWNDLWHNPEVAARRSDCFETQPGPASVWIRLGELKAQKIDCAPFDKTRFESALMKIRGLTRKNPDKFLPEMQRLCSESGVALVLVREIKKVPWNGASKWLSPNKAMILLSLRGKGEDIFWFSFFHESCHILNGKKQRLYIAEKKSTDPEEIKADRFASNLLIPERYDSQIRLFDTNDQVIRLADELGLCPSIVAGRFRHLTEQWSRFKDLTRTFTWECER